MTQRITWALTGLLFTTIPLAASATPPTPAATASATQSGAGMTEAEVRKVDVNAGKITLKHGEIKNLDMPPMSMVFVLKDPALLGQVKAGDKVRFTADKINGAYTVTALEPLP